MQKMVQKMIIPEVDANLELLKREPNRFSANFDLLGRPGSIDNLNWDEFPDRPEVSFRIGWKEEFLFVKFYVKEGEILGSYTRDGSPVCRDSCVELFLSPEGASGYYNFEFNCIGCCLLCYGESREGRKMLAPETLKQIFRIPSLGLEPLHRVQGASLEERETWSLLAVIPVSVFSEHGETGLSSFAAARMRGNLYSCGDALQKPHFLSWNPVKTENPDFHRPEYFGELWFA